MSKSARDPNKKKLFAQLIAELRDSDTDEEALKAWWGERGHDPDDIRAVVESALLAATMMDGMRLTTNAVRTALWAVLMLGYKLGALDTEELMQSRDA